MDIKYTIEILTKDIQDIEKLVGKLQNSKDASAIELDLAMSKLRNVYEILTMIKADKFSELVNHSLNGSQEPDFLGHEAETDIPEPKVDLEVHIQEEAHIKPEPEVKSDPVAAATVQPEVEEEAELKAEPEINAEVEIKAESEIKEEVEVIAEADKKSDAEDPTILAEKFQAESSINENLAETRNEPLDSKLLGSAIDNIGRNIGINDRFLIIRELFDGNSDDFSKLLSQLDGAENYENANKILTSHFLESMEHGGVEILAGLVKRRYPSQ